MQNLNFTKLKTSAGVSLYVMHLPHANTVASGVLINAGTRDEQWPKEAGIAHALEHMFFHGTEKFPTSKEYAAYLEDVGGFANAWTWKEMTFYHNQVPAKYKARSVEALSELINRPLFPKDKIASEIKNIIQELHRRNDNPKRYSAYLAEKLLYGEHPLGKDGLGLEESLSSLTRQNLLDFKTKYYHAGNFAFIAAGKITPKQAKDFFERHFPEKSRNRPNLRPNIPLNNETSSELIEKRKDISQSNIFMVAPLGSSTSKETRAIEMFSIMISGGNSFPLFQEIRDKLGLCYEIWSSVIEWHDVGEFDLYIGTDPAKKDEAINAALKVIEASKKDAALLEKAKNVRVGNLAIQFENPDYIINQAASDIALLGEPKGLDEITKEISQITIDDVEKAVEKYLNPNSIKIAVLMPEN